MKTINMSQKYVMAVKVYINNGLWIRKYFVIRNIKGIDYSCVIWNITKYDAINWSYNSELDDNGTALCYNKTPIEVTK